MLEVRYLSPGVCDLLFVHCGHDYILPCGSLGIHLDGNLNMDQYYEGREVQQIVRSEDTVRMPIATERFNHMIVTWLGSAILNLYPIPVFVSDTC